jgi:hypothetical protein
MIALQTLLTPQATAGWHYISVYPFVTVVAAYGVYAVAQAVLRGRRGLAVVLACVGALALTYDGALLGRYLHSLASREPVNPGWSPAVYALSRDLQRVPGRVFTADWGILNPLFALHPSHRYTEWTFALESATSTGTLLRALSTTAGPTLLVTHADGKLVFPQTRAHLLELAAHHLVLTRTVLDRDGKPVYEIYAYRAGRLLSRSGSRVSAAGDPARGR